jgi:hypothetical protein
VDDNADHPKSATSSAQTYHADAEDKDEKVLFFDDHPRSSLGSPVADRDQQFLLETTRR